MNRKIKQAQPEPATEAAIERLLQRIRLAKGMDASSHKVDCAARETV